MQAEKILQEMIRFNGGPTDWDVRCKHEQGVRLKNQEYAEKQREQMSETKGDLIKRREACTQTEPHTDAAHRGKNRMEEAEAGHRAEERLVRAAEDAHRNARVMCRILVHVQDGLALDRLTLESNIQKLGNVSNKIEAVLKNRSRKEHGEEKSRLQLLCMNQHVRRD